MCLPPVRDEIAAGTGQHAITASRLGNPPTSQVAIEGENRDILRLIFPKSHRNRE